MLTLKIRLRGELGYVLSSSCTLQIQDKDSDQYFAVTTGIHSINSGADDVLRIDVFVSDHALSQVMDVSKYEGSSLDLRLNLPDNIFNFDKSNYSFIAHEDFFYAEAEYYSDNNSIIFGAFSDSIFEDNDKPILSIDVLVDDVSALSGKSGNVTLDLVKMSEVFIPNTDDSLDMVYTIYLDDLIVTPIEQTI